MVAQSGGPEAGRERDPGAHQATLTLNTLGRLEICWEGRPVTGLKSRKAQALLVYLALDAGTHSRGRLAGLLWGDLPEEHARRNLRHALWTLRQHLSPHALDTPRRSAGLSTHVVLQIDVLTFEARVEQAGHCQQAGQAEAAMDHLQAAVGLYREDFLAHFDLPDCPEFEEWVMRRRLGLRQQVREAFSHLSAYHARRGEYGPALEYTRRQLAMGPWWEEGHRQMMRLLALSGRRSEALAQYETCLQVLAEELGVEPVAETTRLYQQIREGEIGRGGEGEKSPHLPISLSPHLTSPVQEPAFLEEAELPEVERPVFVARERELAQLGRYLDSALAGLEISEGHALIASTLLDVTLMILDDDAPLQPEHLSALKHIATDFLSRPELTTDDAAQAHHLLVEAGLRTVFPVEGELATLYEESL